MSFSAWNSPPEPGAAEPHELSPRLSTSSSIAGDDNADDDDPDLEALPTHGLLSPATRTTKLSPLPHVRTCGWQLRLLLRRTAGVRHRWARLTLGVLGCLLFFTAVFNPSYTRGQYPENYRAVTDSVQRGGGRNPVGFWRDAGSTTTKTTADGRGNPRGEKVYIAANIVDAGLVRGAWGDAVLELMDLLGEQNVFLSE